MLEEPKIDIKPSTQPTVSTPKESFASSPNINQDKTSDPVGVNPQQALAPQSQELQFNVDNQNQFNLFGGSPEKLLDFSKPPLYGRVELPSAETTSPPKESSSSPISSPIKQGGVQTVPFDIGPLPEPKPNIVYRRTGSESPQNAPSAPLKTGPASEVPNISSSNSSNMYILYSQVNYNVVM
jgi:hypothetical protein